MAQSGNRLLRAIERPHECPRVFRLPQQVRIDEAAGNQQRVVVVGGSFVDCLRHTHASRGLVQVPRMRPRRSDTTSASAPSARSATSGTTSSTISNPSAARMAVCGRCSHRKRGFDKPFRSTVALPRNTIVSATARVRRQRSSPHSTRSYQWFVFAASAPDRLPCARRASRGRR
jgi:hypothetical protein